jgi:hypothetical protein
MGFTSFAQAPPNLHFWGGSWNSGGFSTHHLEEIYNLCRTRVPPAPTILETGAGNSTICFLQADPARVISIAPDQELFDRILDYCRANDIDTKPLQTQVEGSEWALPRLASNGRRPQLDLALIDGCHGFPMVMIDFFYINIMLKKGSFLLVDDVQLHSCAELARLLSYQTAQFRLVANLGKLQIFEKITDDPLLGGWGMQPYVSTLSGHRTGPLLNKLITGMISLRSIKQNRLKWKK